MEIADSGKQRKEGPGATFGPRGPTNTAVCNYFYLKTHSSLPYFLAKVDFDKFPLPCGLVFLAPLVAQFRPPQPKKSTKTGQVGFTGVSSNPIQRHNRDSYSKITAVDFH